MTLARFKKLVDRALEATLVGLFGTLLLAVVWQVVSRYLMGAPSSFTEEVARFSFIALSLLGAAYVAGQQGHLAVGLLSESAELTRKKSSRAIDSEHQSHVFRSANHGGARFGAHLVLTRANFTGIGTPSGMDLRDGAPDRAFDWLLFGGHSLLASGQPTNLSGQPRNSEGAQSS